MIRVIPLGLTDAENVSKIHKSDYILLHFNIIIFSFTGVLSKLASIEFAKYHLHSYMLYLYIFLMLLNCFIYALFWQKNIEKIDLSVAYAHRSVYIIWSQLWAFLLFSEKINACNIAGMLLVLAGILLV